MSPRCRYGCRRKLFLSMVITTYVETVYVPGRLTLQPSTVAQYLYAAKSLQKFYSQPVEVDSLCDDLILPWLAARLRQVSPRTVKRERGDLLTIWRWAHRKGHCPNPPIDIPPIKCVRHMPTYWTVDELERMIAACRALSGELRDTAIPKAAWWSSFILFLYDTGCRLSAALAVSPRELDLAERRVLLNGNAAKTGIEQSINLSDQTIAAVAGHYATGRARVWPWPYDHRRIWIKLKQILAAAGLPTDRTRMFHCLRRTTATLTAAHSSIDVARRQLGHASEAMTRNYINESALALPQSVDVLPRPNL